MKSMKSNKTIEKIRKMKDETALSINIKTNLYRKLKSKAALDGLTLKELLNKLLDEFLNKK